VLLIFCHETLKFDIIHKYYGGCNCIGTDYGYKTWKFSYENPALSDESEENPVFNLPTLIYKFTGIFMNSFNFSWQFIKIISFPKQILAGGSACTQLPLFNIFDRNNACAQNEGSWLRALLFFLLTRRGRQSERAARCWRCEEIEIGPACVRATRSLTRSLAGSQLHFSLQRAQNLPFLANNERVPSRIQQ